MANDPKKVPLQAYVDSRLLDLVVADAKRSGKYLNEIVATVLAAHYDRPELGIVPRKRVGRKLGTKIKKKK